MNEMINIFGRKQGRKVEGNCGALPSPLAPAGPN